jgi:hypothetical protein
MATAIDAEIARVTAEEGPESGGFAGAGGSQNAGESREEL